MLRPAFLLPLLLLLPASSSRADVTVFDSFGPSSGYSSGFDTVGPQDYFYRFTTTNTVPLYLTSISFVFETVPGSTTPQVYPLLFEGPVPGATGLLAAIINPPSNSHADPTLVGASFFGTTQVQPGEVLTIEFGAFGPAPAYNLYHSPSATGATNTAPDDGTGQLSPPFVGPLPAFRLMGSPTLPVVPEPGTLALAGLLGTFGGVHLWRRK